MDGATLHVSTLACIALYSDKQKLARKRFVTLDPHRNAPFNDGFMGGCDTQEPNVRFILLRDITLLLKFFRIEIAFLLLGNVIQNMCCDCLGEIKSNA
jgi:hypothetical protein